MNRFYSAPAFSISDYGYTLTLMACGFSVGWHFRQGWPHCCLKKNVLSIPARPKHCSKILEYFCKFIYLSGTFRGYLSPYRHSSFSVRSVTLETQWHRSGLITEGQLQGCIPKATTKTWNIIPAHRNLSSSSEAVTSFAPKSLAPC